MKKIVTTKEYKFTAVIKPAEEGGFYAYCPLLPGCATQGETYTEAVANIEDAIKGYVESMIAHGDPLPREALTTNYFLEIPITLPKKLALV
jgi:predicted RNase H-like HicB family nuclease